MDLFIFVEKIRHSNYLPGYSCYYIHAKMAQAHRNRVFHDFRCCNLSSLLSILALLFPPLTPLLPPPYSFSPSPGLACAGTWCAPTSSPAASTFR